jgi:hypothetical protein
MASLDLGNDTAMLANLPTSSSTPPSAVRPRVRKKGPQVKARDDTSIRGDAPSMREKIEHYFRERFHVDNVPEEVAAHVKEDPSGNTKETTIKLELVCQCHYKGEGNCDHETVADIKNRYWGASYCPGSTAV